MKLGHVALDGTKLKANASKHKAMSYGRMAQAETALAAEVAGWLAQAEAADAAEDAEHGPEQRGDELPDWVADKQARLARIRAAKAALEAEAKAARRRPRRRARPVFGHERPWPAAARAGRRAAGAGAAQLHRPRQPRAQDPGRLRPGLQRPARGRRARIRSSSPSA